MREGGVLGEANDVKSVFFMAPTNSGESGKEFDDPGLKLPVSSGVLICENSTQSASIVALFDPWRRTSNGGSIPPELASKIHFQ